VKWRQKLGAAPAVNVKDGKLYNFKSDNAGTWHGYQVKTAPTEFLRNLRTNKIITEGQYNKFVKGK